MKAKDRNKEILLEYIGNPENDFPSRKDMAVSVLGYKHQKSMYNHFTPDELTEIEETGWSIRKARTVKQRAEVYHALHKRAIGFSNNGVYYPPETSAGREWLDRTEGKVKDIPDRGNETAQPIKVEIISKDARRTND